MLSTALSCSKKTRCNLEKMRVSFHASPQGAEGPEVCNREMQIKETFPAVMTEASLRFRRTKSESEVISDLLGSPEDGLDRAGTDRWRPADGGVVWWERLADADSLFCLCLPPPPPSHSTRAALQTEWNADAGTTCSA